MQIKEEIIRNSERIEKELNEGKDVVIKKSKSGIKVQALSVKEVRI